jgi:hypothetical protein
LQLVQPIKMSKQVLVVVIVAILSAVGCMPVGRMPPTYLAETGPVLQPGQVSVTGVAGAGGDTGGDAHGEGARVRVGVGAGQEIGVEASSLALHQQNESGGFFDGSPPTYVDSHAYAAKLSWKAALNDKVSLLAGAGAAYTSGGVDDAAYKGLSLGADVGFVASAGTIHGITPYAGARLSLSHEMPGAHATMDTGDAATTGFVTLSGGFAMPLFSTARLFVEGGATSWITSDPTSLLDDGLYALVGVGVTLGR